MEGTNLAAGHLADMGKLLDDYMSAQRYRRGDIIDGVIASVSPRSILIDIGGKCDAVVHPREVERMSDRDRSSLRPGQDVSVYVVDNEDEDGSMVVSLARAAQESDWEEAQDLLDNGDSVTLTVVDTNKGGVIVRLGKLRGFVPGSQLMPGWRSYQRGREPEERWNALMGKKLTLSVIEVTPERNRLILSERNAQTRDESKRAILESLEIGSIQEGIISNVVPFGAFVNVQGVDGLLHVSELSWKRVNNPQEIVQVGQKVKVYILDIDLDRERLGLSLKRLTPDPWSTIHEVCQEGHDVAVKVVNLTGFGAFAALVERPELEGLIHISELSDTTIEHPSQVVAVGDQLLVKVLSMRPKDRRIAFSLKAVQEQEPQA